ncbi:MAG: hypothetical protein ACKVOE_04620 [Rickettsiales bacterium]
MNLIEGVDYIFDRYAFIGLTPAATDEEIAAAIKRMKSENHPDRYTKTSEEARNSAARKWERIEECETFLANSGRRAAFDEQLARFQKESPRLISESGTPIFDPSRSRIDLNAMLGEPESLETHEKLVGQMVGFNPNMLAILEQVYKGNPNDSATREAYRDVLVKGMGHYDILADGVWEQAGARIGEAERNGTTRIMIEDFSAGVKEKIQKIADAIPTKVQEHFGLIENGMAAPLQLTYAGTQSGAGVTTDVPPPSEIADIARENFLNRTHRLKQLAEKHQELAQKLLDTMQVWPLSADEVQTDVKRFILMGKASEDAQVMTALVAIDIDSSSNGITNYDISVNGKTLEELKAGSLNTTTIALETHPEIQDYLVYATYHYGKILEQPTIDQSK